MTIVPFPFLLFLHLNQLLHSLIRIFFFKHLPLRSLLDLILRQCFVLFFLKASISIGSCNWTGKRSEFETCYRQSCIGVHYTVNTFHIRVRKGLTAWCSWMRLEMHATLVLKVLVYRTVDSLKLHFIGNVFCWRFVLQINLL